jgi:hypothetical protein
MNRLLGEKPCCPLDVKNLLVPLPLRQLGYMRTALAVQVAAIMCHVPSPAKVTEA